MSDDNGYTSGISATIKASEGFDAPWIVVHAQDVEELRNHLLALNESDVMAGIAQLSRKFQGNFEQKPRYQNNSRGVGGWKGGSGARSATGTTATSTASVPTPAAPPPAFVPNQQAQPAGWGQQQMQQQLGAQVMGQAPNEIAFCTEHNTEREFNEAFFNNRTQRNVSASWRCPVKTCKPYWQQPDGSWQRGK